MCIGKYLIVVVYYLVQFIDIVLGFGIDGVVILIDVKDCGKDKICVGLILVRGEIYSVRQKDFCIVVSIFFIWYVYYVLVMFEFFLNLVLIWLVQL